MNKLVTVVIPSYNHQNYIKEAIESIINQSYKNIELIVIDDGSIDSSPKILDSLSKKYGFKYIHRENRGLSKTLNEALELAKGEYFSICASDDRFILDKVYKQVKFLENNLDYAVCYGNVIAFNNSGIEKRVNVKNGKSRWIFKELITADINIPAPSSMMRTHILREVGGYSEDILIEDWDMWLRVANIYKIGYLNEYLAYYRDHEKNTYKQTYKMFEAQKKILEKWSDYKYYNQALKIWQLYWFKSLSRHGYRDEAKRYIKVAIKNLFDIDTFKILLKYHLIRF